MKPARRLPLLSFISTVSAVANAAEPAAPGLELFEQRVRPILLEHCAGCHGPDKQKRQLRLDSPLSIARGGESGPLIHADRPDESLLLRAVGHTDPDLKMPPKRKLADRDIDALTRWVRLGAPLPIGEQAPPIPAQQEGVYDWAAWSGFWSFKPLAPPTLSDSSTSPAQNSVDQLLDLKRRDRGLACNPPADRRTLIRRASLDLLGLPPTPQESDAFVADESPEAWPALIERLLASPHYGERWGRHWLDVARHVQGEVKVQHERGSRGGEDYRDYVVRAFNHDKPYSRFILEQLAGDLLPPDAGAPGPGGPGLDDRLTATAFLSIGHWFDECPDPHRLRMDMIDEMLSSTGQAFLGLSLQCARCHDHKFDPIPARDYYALAGIFHSTQVLESLSENWKDGRLRKVRPLAEDSELTAYDQRIEANRVERESVWREIDQRHAQALARWIPRREPWVQAATQLAKGVQLSWPAAEFDGQVNLKVTPIGAPADDREWLESAKPFASWVRYLPDVPTAGDYDVEAVYANDGDVGVLVKLNGDFLKQRLRFPDTGGLRPERLRTHTTGRVTLRQGVNALQLHMDRGRMPRLLTIRLRLHDAGRDAAIADSAKQLDLDPRLLAQLVRLPDGELPSAADMEGLLSPDDPLVARMRKVRAERAALTAQWEQWPKVIAARDAPAAEIGDLPVHVGGDAHRPAGPPVPRGVPRLLAHALASPTVPQGQSGRLQLAQWIADPRNPLTARVMVNRIWQGHFGRGLVASPSDFGSRGETPTHPELMDHLADAFHRSGGSIKAMHRLIMNSQAYRLSSDPRGPGREADPQNLWLWRFPSRRLEVEAIYDSMLYTAGRFRPSPPGAPLDRAKLGDRAMYVLASGRSPVGLGQHLRAMYPLFGLEMEAVPQPRRDASTTPAQALWWMNNPVPDHYAKLLAQRAMAVGEDDRARCEALFRYALSRTPESGELAELLAYVTHCRRFEVQDSEVWRRVALAVYSSQEFQRLP